MRKCYHRDCDHWNQNIATTERYKFMTAIAQSLIFSVAEMAMEGHENNCIKKTVQHIIKKASTSEVDLSISLNLIPKADDISTERPKRW